MNFRERQRGPFRPHKIETDNRQPTREPDASLVQALARAHSWRKALAAGAYQSVEDLAATVEWNSQSHSQGVAACLLAPDITEAILRSGHRHHAVEAARNFRMLLGRAASLTRFTDSIPCRVNQAARPGNLINDFTSVMNSITCNLLKTVLEIGSVCSQLMASRHRWHAMLDQAMARPGLRAMPAGAVLRRSRTPASSPK